MPTGCDNRALAASANGPGPVQPRLCPAADRLKLLLTAPGAHQHWCCTVHRAPCFVIPSAHARRPAHPPTHD